MDGSLIVTNALSQSEEITHTLHIFRNGASPSDAVQSHPRTLHIKVTEVSLSNANLNGSLKKMNQFFLSGSYVYIYVFFGIFMCFRIFMCFGIFMCFRMFMCFGIFMCFRIFMCFGIFMCFWMFMCFGVFYEKRGEYLDLAREQKKLQNMKVKVIPIVVSALGTIPKWLIKGLEDLEIRGRVETI